MKNVQPPRKVNIAAKSSKFKSAAQIAQPRQKELSAFPGFDGWYTTRNPGQGYADYTMSSTTVVGGLNQPLTAV